MQTQELQSSQSPINKRIIELAIQLGAVFILLLWCFKIIEPFLLVVTWGIIVAIALYPIYGKISARLGRRPKLTAFLFTLILIAILVVPAIMLTESLLSGLEALADAGKSGQISIPPPSEAVAQWPLVGEKVFDLWQYAAANPPGLIEEFAPQLHAIGGWLLETVAGTGLGILQFLISFIIAGILLANAAGGARAAEAFATRLAGSRGPEFAALSSLTIGNVAIGIVGVSIVQTVLLSIGFLVMGIPAAGLLALIVLVLCIIQIGPGLVVIPVIIYVFSTAETTPAVVFTIWTVAMTFIDSILKPIVFSRGATVPTLVIFLGAIGGMIAHGLIGLFVGAVILSLGYDLYIAWLDETPRRERDTEEAEG